MDRIYKTLLLTFFITAFVATGLVHADMREQKKEELKNNRTRLDEGLEYFKGVLDGAKTDKKQWQDRLNFRIKANEDGIKSSRKNDLEVNVELHTRILAILRKHKATGLLRDSNIVKAYLSFRDSKGAQDWYYPDGFNDLNFIYHTNRRIEFLTALNNITIQHKQNGLTSDSPEWVSFLKWCDENRHTVTGQWGGIDQIDVLESIHNNQSWLNKYEDEMQIVDNIDPTVSNDGDVEEQVVDKSKTHVIGYRYTIESVGNDWNENDLRNKKIYDNTKNINLDPKLEEIKQFFIDEILKKDLKNQTPERLEGFWSTLTFYKKQIMSHFDRNVELVPKRKYGQCDPIAEYSAMKIRREFQNSNYHVLIVGGDYKPLFRKTGAHAAVIIVKKSMNYMYKTNETIGYYVPHVNNIVNKQNSKLGENWANVLVLDGWDKSISLLRDWNQRFPVRTLGLTYQRAHVKYEIYKKLLKDETLTSETIKKYKKIRDDQHDLYESERQKWFNKYNKSPVKHSYTGYQ